MNTSSKNFGQYVKEKRQEKGLAQKQLAEIVGYSVNTIRAIEQNRSNYVPSSQMVTALSKALEVSEDDLKLHIKARESHVTDENDVTATSPNSATGNNKKAVYQLAGISMIVLIVVISLALSSISGSNVSAPTETLYPVVPEFTGGWVGHNYMCGGVNYTEKVRLELRRANYLVATKIDGDPCVGPGEISWEGEYHNPNEYPYTFAIKLWITTAQGEKTAMDSTAVMVDPNRIEIQSGSYLIVFTNDDIATPTPIGDVPDVVIEEPIISPGWETNEPICDGSWNNLYRFPTSSEYFNYLTLNVQAPDQPINSAIWKPNLPVAGKWRVEMFNLVHQYYVWPCLKYALPADTSYAKYVISHSGGESEVIIDQQSRGNVWMDLGTYEFESGSDGQVYLSNLTGDKSAEVYVLFSKIRFIYVEP